MKVRPSRRARADLKAIFDYIAKDSPRNAEAVVERLLDAVDRLTFNQGLMRTGSIVGTQECVVPRTGCVVIYRLVKGEVVVLRIWRSARGAPTLR